MIFHFPFVLTQIRKYGESFKAGILNNRVNRVFFYISSFLCVSLLAATLVAGWKLRAIGEAVAIRYNIYFGVDLVGNWSTLFVYPLLAIGISAINFFAGGLVYRKTRLLSYFIVGSTPVMLIIDIVTLVFVLLLTFEFIEK